MAQTSVSRPRRPRRWAWGVALACLALVATPWVVVNCQRAARQRDAVKTVQSRGGWAFYNCRYGEDGSLLSAGVPGPSWVTGWFGPDFFGRVDGVTLAGSRKLDGLPKFDFVLDHGIPVTDAHVASLTGMPDLQWLALSGTGVTDVGLAHLAGLRRLERLWLDDTQVSDAGLACLAQLTQLERLWLDGARIGNPGLRHLQGLVRLKTLSLARTAVGDASLECLAGMTRLETLNLDHTACTFLGVIHLLCDVQGRRFDDALRTAGYVRWERGGEIVSLDLSATRFDNEGAALVGKLTGLERLSLQGTQIDDAGLERLASLSNLTFLHLADTNVTDAGLSHLKSIGRLETLHLEGTRVTDRGVDEFLRSTVARPRIYRAKGNPQ